MSKRMIRIKSGNLFSQLQSLRGLSLNAILENGKTYFGVLLSITEDFITIADSRLHEHKLPISSVYEVIYDHQSD